MRTTPPARLQAEKLALIDFACDSLKARSFADLGSVWGVDGGYIFYAMEKPETESGYLVDTDVTESALRRSSEYPGLEVVEGNFGDPAIARRIGAVDAVILFDVLLHQVAPDWDEILAMYAGRTRCFLIVNPQFTASRKTVRLLDLGEEEYFKNVPHAKDEEPYRSVFRDPQGIDPRHARRRRDIHNIWQWGIVDGDLSSTMKGLGFEQRYSKNAGQWGALPSFEYRAFAFEKL
jgi:hypothetical protein